MLNVPKKTSCIITCTTILGISNMTLLTASYKKKKYEVVMQKLLIWSNYIFFISIYAPLASKKFTEKGRSKSVFILLCTLKWVPGIRNTELKKRLIGLISLTRKTSNLLQSWDNITMHDWCAIAVQRSTACL